MELVVRKMGNSLGLTFPTAILRDLDITVGQSFEMKKGTGGTLVLRPKAMRKTPYTVDVQCATGILHLKDRAGVSFAGSGPGTGTRHSRELRRLVCAASIPAPKKKGRG